ncbi:MAG: chemotaxis protein CheD [Deltaproteobacteria bacterium]|nr:chemotaxis protein CheD [Deltaproteobacteria bacterium]
MNLIVGVSDMKVSNNIEAIPVARVGGLLHYMLPESSLDTVKAKKNPYMFADTGIPSLFKAAYKLGAKKQRLKVILIGGSQILDQKGFFNIGKRNETAARKMFHKNNVIISYKDVGGVVNRTVKLAVNNGDTWIKVSGKGEKKI